MRILVCGDRNWTDKALIVAELTKRIGGTPDHVLIHGSARGADVLASEAASELREINGVKVFHALWNKHGRAAGPIRNQQMLDEGKPDLVLAFHDDIERSKGTKDMVARARKAGIPVEIISHGQTIAQR